MSDALAIDLFCGLGAATYKTHPSEYSSWSCMRSRCRNPRVTDWRLYGGRGITVCTRWDSFAAFFEDMGPKPSSRHSLDRIDCDGNYEPSNCRWSTPKEQANNWKHRNRKISFGDETLPLSVWAERIGITRESLRDRLDSGWPIGMALVTPAVRHRRRASDGTFKTAGN